MHITLSFPAASVKGEVWSVTKHSACEVENIPHCSAQWRLPHPGPAETDLPASLRGHPPSLVASPPAPVECTGCDAEQCPFRQGPLVTST